MEYRSKGVVVRYLTTVYVTVTGSLELWVTSPTDTFSPTAPGARKVIKIAEEKIKHEIRGKCPWCNKLIISKVTERTLVAAVKAEKEVNYSIEKDHQSKLPKE